MKVVFLFFLLSFCNIAEAQFHRSDSLRHPARTFDEKLFWNINHMSDTSALTDAFMLTTSNSLLPVAITVPTGLFLSGVLNNNSTYSYDGLTIGAGVLTSILFQELLLKNLFRRDRPFKTLEDVRWIDSGAHGFSFPSGHATISCGLAVALSLRYPKWYVIAPSALYAALVTISRSYLGVHYPTDILAGAIIGSVIQYLAYRIEQSIPTPGFILHATPSPAIISFSIPVQ